MRCSKCTWWAVRRLKQVFGDACMKGNASRNFRSVFNTIGNDLVRYPNFLPSHLPAVISDKAGTDVAFLLFRPTRY